MQSLSGLQHEGFGEADVIFGIIATPIKLKQMTEVMMRRAITFFIIKKEGIDCQWDQSIVVA